MVSRKLYDENTERACIAAAINFQEQLVDVFTLVSEEHFYLKAHQTIFSAIKSFVLNGIKFDVVILTEKLITLGLKHIEDLDIIDYIYAIKSSDSINESAMMGYFQLLHKYFHARSLIKTSKKIEEFVYENQDKTAKDLVFGVEKIFSEKVNQFQSDDSPVDLVAGLEEKIELLGNEPKVEGLRNPYPTMRKLYGDFLPGGLYIYVAPAKVGKSTFLLDIAEKVSGENPNCKVLILDTELKTEEQQYRLVSNLSGVNEAYIRSGLWRTDSEKYKSVTGIWPKVKEMLGRIDHMYVAGKPIDELLSIARRWYYKNRKDDFIPLIVLDYVKLTGEKVTDSWKEYQVIGQKADKLKMLAQELSCPVVTAMQTNREGDYVAMSSQVRWFCSQLAILNRKSPEELQRDGDKFGTHKLTVTESRNQGLDARGHRDFVIMPDGKPEKIYLSFEFNNFKVKDRGSLEDIVDGLSDVIDLDKQSEDVEF